MTPAANRDREQHARCDRRRVGNIARVVAPLAWFIAAALHAQNAPGYTHDAPGYTQSDFGGVGLMQTPTARMAEEGEFSFVMSRVQPYTFINVSAQPFAWLEASARYTIVSNRFYGPNGLPDPNANGQNFKDKSIDAKVHLRSETHYLPEMAIGIRDLAGTGLFSGEYVVASKRVGPFDFSLGLGWGYLGARGDLPNPFGWIDPAFNHRPVLASSATAGTFTASRYFRGPTALFGGVEYQTPYKWLRLKAELDGNNYKHEGLNNNQIQRWPVNLGALFRVTRFADVTVGYERGDRFMASLSLHDNLAQQTESSKPLDPLPEPIAATSASQTSAQPLTTPAQADWAAISRILEDNAGIVVEHIAQRGSELLVYGEQKRFFYGAEGLGRAARLLNNRLDNSIDWITFVSQNHGLPVVEDSVHRQRFVDLLHHDVDLHAFARSVEQDATAPQQEHVLYKKPLKKFDFGVSPGFDASLGGVNAPILYQVTADANATYHFTRNLWLDAEVDVNLLNNYSIYTYDAPSRLPRVRTDVRKYLESSNVTLPNFQLTGTRQLSTDLYGMAYAGMFESMFGGVGGEMLYRPVGEHWAFGVDANFVRQRGFNQDFSFRTYQIATGHATLYLDTGFDGLHLALSGGRYLAGDWGTTVDVSRHFPNGVQMGAYATITTAGRAYGEGSFDKGVYLSVPFDLFLPRSRNKATTFRYQPLLRDGGARLNKTYNLYDMTSDRDSYLFDQNLDKITQ